MHVPGAMRTQLRGSTWSSWTHSSPVTPHSTRSIPTSCGRLPPAPWSTPTTPGRRCWSRTACRLPGLWVILTGSMDIVHDGEPIQVLEPGECFGHPSLLTGMAPAFTVRAREPSSCALFSAEAGRQHPRDRGGRRLRRDLDAEAHHVRRPHRARAARSRHHAGVAGDEPCGVLRARRAAAGGGGAAGAGWGLSAADARGRRGTRDPDRCFRAGGGRRRRRATRRAGTRTRHEARWRPCRRPNSRSRRPSRCSPPGPSTWSSSTAIGSAACFRRPTCSGLDTRSPIALRHMLLGAPDEDTLVRAAGEIPKLFLLLSRAGVLPRDLSRVLSLQHDTVVARLIDFSIWTRGPAPAPVGVARPRKRGPEGVHPRFRPGQRARVWERGA